MLPALSLQNQQTLALRTGSRRRKIAAWFFVKVGDNNMLGFMLNAPVLEAAACSLVVGKAQRPAGKSG